MFSQFPPVVLAATIEFFTVHGPPMPPPLPDALLPVIVALSSVASDSLSTPPPFRPAAFVVRVELVTVRMPPPPRFLMPPPSSDPAVLPTNVERLTVAGPASLCRPRHDGWQMFESKVVSSMVTSPSLLAMPPPSSALLALIVERRTVVVAVLPLL